MGHSNSFIIVSSWYKPNSSQLKLSVGISKALSSYWRVFVVDHDKGDVLVIKNVLGKCGW
jgi:hypothetical protein